MPDGFHIHDVSNFPLVRFRADRVSEGYVATWMNEMEALIAGEPFALMFDSMETGESAEDYKRRGTWLKENHDRLAQVCRALVAVEPDDRKRMELRTALEKRTRAFGVRQMVAANVAEAEAMCRLALKAALGA